MLTERQETILRLIIQNYTNLGQPVGSKKLMEDGVEASSATIRNEMKNLEDAGLLSKTHSSSGRVPSITGYRYYVDHLLKPSQVDKKEIEIIRQSFGREFHEINEIIQQSANILSTLTSYTTLSLGPDVKDRKLTGFRMIPLNNRQVIAIIVTDKGNVESQVFTIPKYLNSEDLEKMVRIINDKLIGEPLLTVYHRLRTEIPMNLHKYFQTTDGVLDLFEEMLNHIFEDKIFVGGRMNLLNFEQNQNVEQFRSMYSFMKNTDNLNQLLAPRDGAIQIRIGSELGDELLNNMSMIQASYDIEGHGKGTIALLGPTSMPYSKMFGLMDVFRKELALTLADYYRTLDS
ncbi:heat-inducible transcriptional repressor HrcA [Enterococcus saccharolyticus]|uniref:Heat-inducible transcription repressor HrcA n=1 Tax=Candidatus Enterococcus willemsii TaxID=1857215 RepID=A0ABQ6YYY0_9ENTE|nr:MULTISPECIES: heat-inducible transcriptional repressor HrcA [Enterococcus]KAF1302880.1 heat-inducible transcriptional repressor HrcA [Enterococcus sp. CU12B]MCD5000970.1 heat-inducible transcriptional repressor HrcA [Enterococcus saccharolyticus]